MFSSTRKPPDLPMPCARRKKRARWRSRKGTRRPRTRTRSCWNVIAPASRSMKARTESALFAHEAAEFPLLIGGLIHLESFHPIGAFEKDLHLDFCRRDRRATQDAHALNAADIILVLGGDFFFRLALPGLRHPVLLLRGEAVQEDLRLAFLHRPNG